MSTGNPPWYEVDENGEIMILEVPARLKSHPEIIRRGFEPLIPIKIGVVYVTLASKGPEYFIKILDTDTEEATIFQQLSRLVDPRNPTIPGELTSPEVGHPLLITPGMASLTAIISLKKTLPRTLSIFLQLMEGIEFMHSLRIAHMDICPGNLVASVVHMSQLDDPNVEPDKVYFIDFGSSLQLPLGPGSQHAITLPPSQFGLAYDITRFDPYSWDVYCAALTMEKALEVRPFEYRCVYSQLLVMSRKTCYGNDSPLIARLYAGWVKGKERGCSTVCRCRPTARRARQLLTGILWGVRVWERFKNALCSLKELLLPPVS
ncbi:hypothetical protein GY45DRAFT_1322376 [Cubamyces sp. BRFM 1775]|nr:hypothetical protein GY45DRAFT_1322376 [Cubamyces sp. BRFM 1775]